MSEIERREQKFEKVNRAFTALYLLMCLAMIVVYAVRRDGSASASRWERR